MRNIALLAICAISACITTTSAFAQSREMQDLLRKKYQIEQQKADAEKKRAEAAAAAASAANRSSGSGRSNSTSAPHLLSEGDPLENTDAPKCKVASGVTIRVSGSFRPSSGTKCVAEESRPEIDVEANAD